MGKIEQPREMGRYEFPDLLGLGQEVKPRAGFFKLKKR